MNTPKLQTNLSYIFDHVFEQPGQMDSLFIHHLRKSFFIFEYLKDQRQCSNPITKSPDGCGCNPLRLQLECSENLFVSRFWLHIFSNHFWKWWSVHYWLHMEWNGNKFTTRIIQLLLILDISISSPIPPPLLSQFSNKAGIGRIFLWIDWHSKVVALDTERDITLYFPN